MLGGQSWKTDGFAQLASSSTRGRAEETGMGQQGQKLVSCPESNEYEKMTNGEFDESTARDLAWSRLLNAVRGLIIAHGHDPDEKLRITDWSSDIGTATPLRPDRIDRRQAMQDRANWLLKISDHLQSGVGAQSLAESGDDTDTPD